MNFECASQSSAEDVFPLSTTMIGKVHSDKPANVVNASDNKVLVYNFEKNAISSISKQELYHKAGKCAAKSSCEECVDVSQQEAETSRKRIFQRSQDGCP